MHTFSFTDKKLRYACTLMLKEIMVLNLQCILQGPNQMVILKDGSARFVQEYAYS